MLGQLSEESKSRAFANLLHWQEVKEAQERNAKRAQRAQENATEFQQWAATHQAQIGGNQEDRMRSEARVPRRIDRRMLFT